MAAIEIKGLVNGSDFGQALVEVRPLDWLLYLGKPCTWRLIGAAHVTCQRVGFCLANQSSPSGPISGFTSTSPYIYHTSAFIHHALQCTIQMTLMRSVGGRAVD